MPGTTETAGARREMSAKPRARTQTFADAAVELDEPVPACSVSRFDRISTGCADTPSGAPSESVTFRSTAPSGDA